MKASQKLCRRCCAWWDKEYFLRNSNLCRVCRAASFEVGANYVHYGKYTYHMDYHKMNEKIKVTCGEHGDFIQTPATHIRGSGCLRCAKEKLGKHYADSNEDFIRKAQVVHKGKFSYDKVDYINRHKKVVITCSNHGEFNQSPNLHLKGQGCPACSKRPHINTKECLKKFRKKHGDKFSYDKVNYVNAHTKVCIHCHKHGDFYQSPNHHWNGRQCPRCSLADTSHIEHRWLDTIGVPKEYRNFSINIGGQRF